MIIPRNVFVGSRARLEEDGFRWAPSTLMGCRWGLHEESGTCIRQNGGVHLSCPVWHVETLDLCRGATLVQETGSEQVFLLGLDRKDLENADSVPEREEKMQVYENIFICGVMEGYFAVPTTWTGRLRYKTEGFLGSKITSRRDPPKLRYITPIEYITFASGTDLNSWRRTLGDPTLMSQNYS